MKFNIKKKFLAAAVCLALSTSSALAMPSGGTVVVGVDGITVDRGTFAAVGDGATITATTNGVINWGDFSIGDGESLTFALDGHTVLNRVTSEQMSYLLGTLNASDGNLLLSNPNGIFVGGGAEINAQNLMLTTLSLENDAVNNLFKDNGGIVTLTNKNGTNGVKLEGGEISVDEALSLIGGTVTIADGVTITGVDDIRKNPNPNLMDLNIAAGNTVQVEGHDASFVTATAGTENVVDIKNSTGITSNDIIIFGGKVNVTDTALTSKDDEHVQDIFIGAGSDITGDNSGMKVTTIDGNDVAITGSKIINDTYNREGRESHTKIYGSSVTVKDSTVQSNGDIELFAFKSYAYSDNIDNNGEKLDFAASGSKNKLTVDNSTISTNQDNATTAADVVMFGGSVDITGRTDIAAKLKNPNDSNGKNAGIDIFALSGAKVDDGNKIFDLKANATTNKLTIDDTVTFAGGNSGDDENLVGLYAGTATVGGAALKQGAQGKFYVSLYNNYNEGIDIGDITEDTPVEKIHEAASKITDPKEALDILTNIASGNVNLSDEKKKQVVKAIMESSPVVADKTQEIKNQDAASQAEGATAPLENAANVGADSDNGADSAVTVEGNTSDNNESEE